VRTENGPTEQYSISPNKIVVATSGRLDIVNASEAEVIMSESEWTRCLFPYFCDDIVHGNPPFNEVVLGRGYETKSPYPHAGALFRFDDEMEATFAQAIRQSSRAESILISGAQLTGVSLEGVDSIAQAIASSTSLQYLMLHSLDQTMDQDKIDTFFRRLGDSQMIKSLKLFECTFPGRDAFRSLCESHVDSIWIEACNSSDATFERELYRFASLKSIHFERCSSSLIRACLLSLIGNKTLDQVRISVLRGRFELISAGLDPLLESRATTLLSLGFETFE